MKTLTMKGIFNALPNPGGDGVFTDAVSRTHMIVQDKDDAILVPIINFPFKKGKVTRVTHIPSAAEVRRQWLIGGTTAETIVVNTKYTIGIDHVEAKVGSEARGTVTPYSYTAPAVLSGNADTDRAAVYTALVNKINARYDNFLSAVLVSRMPYTTGATAAPVIGSTLTETDGGETATIVGYTITSGTFAGGNAAGMIYVHTPSAAFEGGASTYTGGSITTTAVFTDAQGIVLVDDAGYFVSPASYRPGASIVTLENGFSIATADIIIDRTYAQGIGSEMLLHMPIYSNPKMDTYQGDMEYTFNVLPDAAKVYTLSIIEVEGSETTAGWNQESTQAIQLHVYADESDGARLTAFKAALDALL